MKVDDSNSTGVIIKLNKNVTSPPLGADNSIIASLQKNFIELRNAHLSSSTNSEAISASVSASTAVMVYPNSLLHLKVISPLLVTEPRFPIPAEQLAENTSLAPVINPNFLGKNNSANLSICTNGFEIPSAGNASLMQPVANHLNLIDPEFKHGTSVSNITPVMESQLIFNGIFAKAGDLCASTSDQFKSLCANSFELLTNDADVQKIVGGVSLALLGGLLINSGKKANAKAEKIFTPVKSVAVKPSGSRKPLSSPKKMKKLTKYTVSTKPAGNKRNFVGAAAVGSGLGLVALGAYNLLKRPLS